MDWRQEQSPSRSPTFRPLEFVASSSLNLHRFVTLLRQANPYEEVGLRTPEHGAPSGKLHPAAPFFPLILNPRVTWLSHVSATMFA
jgi:hypothetical protein